MIARSADAPAAPSLSSRLLAHLQDAMVELEAWRQNARTPTELAALRRLSAALHAAHQEVLENAGGGMMEDTNQRSFFSDGA